MDIRTIYSRSDPNRPVSAQANAGIVTLPDGKKTKLRKNFLIAAHKGLAGAQAAARAWVEAKRPIRRGKEAVFLSTEAIADYREAAEMLKPFDLTPLQLAERYAAECLADPGGTFAQACQSYLEDPATVARGAKYVNEARRFLARASDAFGARPCDRVNAETLQAFLAAQARGEASWKAYRTFLSNVFNYAIKHGRARFNPVVNLKRTDAPDSYSALR